MSSYLLADFKNHKASQFHLSVEKTYLVLKHVSSNTAIWIYGPNGEQESTMYCYHAGTGHMQSRTFAFWQDEDLKSLLITPLCSGGEGAAAPWATFHKDVFIYMTKFFDCRDLLACTLVCKQWRYELLKDCVWQHRLKTPFKAANQCFRQFVCSYALLKEVQGAAMEACLFKDMNFARKVMKNIVSAWCWKYRKFLCDHEIQYQEGVYPPPPAPQEPAERPQKKQKLAALQVVENAKAVLNNNQTRIHRVDTVRTFISKTQRAHIVWKAFAKNAHINAFMCGVLKHMKQVGAVVWITSDAKLKIANPFVAKGHETANVKETLHAMMMDWTDAPLPLPSTTELPSTTAP